MNSTPKKKANWGLLSSSLQVTPEMDMVVNQEEGRPIGLLAWIYEYASPERHDCSLL
jgi:hypothetical protein